MRMKMVGDEGCRQLSTPSWDGEKVVDTWTQSLKLKIEHNCAQIIWVHDDVEM